MIDFACPGCGMNLQVKDEFAGRKTKCRKCGIGLLVPGLSQPSSAQHQNSGTSQKAASISLATSASAIPRRKSPRAKDFLRPPLVYVSLGGGLILLILVTVVVLIVGNGPKAGGNSSSPDAEKKSPVAANVAKPKNPDDAEQNGKVNNAQKKADFKLTADDLLADLRGNELAAERKYKGKTLEVAGLVEKADTALLPQMDPQYFVWLRGRDKDGGSIEAGFSKYFGGVYELNGGPNWPDRNDDLNRKGGAGIPVTIIGTLEWWDHPGLNIRRHAHLRACSMLTTADEILALLKAKDGRDKDAADQAERNAEDEVRKAQAVKVRPSELAADRFPYQKLAGKVVEVTGVVKTVRKGRYDDKSGELLIIELEWDKKPESDLGFVTCSFAVRHADGLAKVRPGQTVKICGRCNKTSSCFLWHCSLLSAK